MKKINLPQARSVLQKLLKEKDYPAQEINRLLIYLYNVSKTADLYILSKTNLSTKQQILFKGICLQLKANQPIAYIVGYQDFAGLRFIITPHVLIPRPETEKLIITDHLWSLLQTKKVTLVDVGTGSGNIIISNYYYLAKKALQENKISLFKNIQFYGVDISASALAITLKNIKTLLKEFKRSNFTSINILKGHLLEPLINNLKPNNNHHQLVIIANLPYIPREEYRNLDKSVKKEPLVALSPKKGVNLVQELINSAPKRTTLFLEDYNADLPAKFEIKKVFTTVRHQYANKQHL